MLRRRLALGLCLLLCGSTVVGSAGYVFEPETPASGSDPPALTPPRIILTSNERYSLACALSLDRLREIDTGGCRIRPPQP